MFIQDLNIQDLKSRNLTLDTVISILLPKTNIATVKSYFYNHLLTKYGTAKAASYRRNFYTEICRDRTLNELFVCLDLIKYPYCVYAYFMLSLALYERKKAAISGSYDIKTEQALECPILPKEFYAEEGCC